MDADRIGLIGVPSSAGARLVGQEQAPEALRRAGLMERLRSGGRDVADLGDLAPVVFAPDAENPRRQNLSRVLGVLDDVAAAVDRAVAEGAWPLIIGGDCTITIGVVAAFTKHFDRFGLIYFDGDLDLNTPETTRSGILDGMVIAHLLGRGADELCRLGERHPLLRAEEIALFGYSAHGGGIDPVEIEILRETPMARYPLEEIEEDVQGAATRALHELEKRVDRILVHFDVDVIDADDFPAADVPHNPGLRLSSVQEALGVFLSSRKTLGLVVTEFNAARDGDGRHARQLTEAIHAAMK